MCIYLFFQWWECWAFPPEWWQCLMQPMTVMPMWRLRNITRKQGRSSTCLGTAFGWYHLLFIQEEMPKVFFFCFVKLFNLCALIVHYSSVRELSFSKCGTHSSLYSLQELPCVGGVLDEETRREWARSVWRLAGGGSDPPGEKRW